MPQVQPHQKKFPNEANTPKTLTPQGNSVNQNCTLLHKTKKIKSEKMRSND